MGHWTPTGVEPKDYDDDDDEAYYVFSMATSLQAVVIRNSLDPALPTFNFLEL